MALKKNKGHIWRSDKGLPVPKKTPLHLTTEINESQHRGVFFAADTGSISCKNQHRRLSHLKKKMVVTTFAGNGIAVFNDGRICLHRSELP
jgi:hypothetical protein